MKTRQGFVSNSSTSSFCIYGASFEGLPDTEEAIGMFKRMKQELGPEYIEAIKKGIGNYTEDYYAVRKNFLKLILDIDTISFDPSKKRGCNHEENEGTKFCPECGAETWIEVVNPNLKIIENMLEEEYDFLETICPVLKLSFTSAGDYGSYIGRDYQTLEDDETGKQFRDSTDKKLELLGQSKGKHIKEAYYC